MASPSGLIQIEMPGCDPSANLYGRWRVEMGQDTSGLWTTPPRPSLLLNGGLQAPTVSRLACERSDWESGIRLGPRPVVQLGPKYS